MFNVPPPASCPSPLVLAGSICKACRPSRREALRLATAASALPRQPPRLQQGLCEGCQAGGRPHASPQKLGMDGMQPLPKNSTNKGQAFGSRWVLTGDGA